MRCPHTDYSDKYCSRGGILSYFVVFFAHSVSVVSNKKKETTAVRNSSLFLVTLDAVDYFTYTHNVCMYNDNKLYCNEACREFFSLSLMRSFRFISPTKLKITCKTIHHFFLFVSRTSEKERE